MSGLQMTNPDAASLTLSKPTDPWCTECGERVRPDGLDTEERCAPCRAETVPGTVRVLLTDLAAQTRELEHLRKQVTELQAANTRLVEERRALDWTAHVRQLFDVFGQAAPRTTGFPDEATIRLRRRMLEEEFHETMEALDARDMVETVDGCIDTIVVALGMLIAFGVDPRPFWTAVHENNLTKANGPVSSTGKRLKPPGWVPPDVAGLLAKQGWRA